MTPTPIIVTSCICGDPACTIPRGKCHCRCDRNVRTGRRYVRGHQAAMRPIREDAVPFKIEGVYCRLIPLRRGFYAIVDATDYDWLIYWGWQAYKYKQTWYALRREWINGKKFTIYMHREILRPAEGKLTDHESGVGLDNRRKNLREADHFENARNQGKRSSRQRYKGVRKQKTWHYRIKTKSGEICVAGFPTEKSAFEARCERVKMLHGEFARVK